MLQGPYREQYQPDHRCQGHYHQPVSPRALQAEEVGEAYRRYPPEYQNGPLHSWDALLCGDQTHPPCVCKPLDLVQAFCVELLFGLGVWLELLNVCADLVYQGPPCRSPLCLGHQGCLSLLHQGILLMNHLFGVGTGEFLEVGSFWCRKPIAQPVDLSQGVGFLLDRFACGLIFLPHRDDHERQEHGVDHAQGRVDEASDVVVGLSRGGGYEALHQLQPGEREEAGPTDHNYAINYGERQRGPPFADLTNQYSSCYSATVDEPARLKQEVGVGRPPTRPLAWALS